MYELSKYARSNCVLEIRFGFRLIPRTSYRVEYGENAFSGDRCLILCCRRVVAKGLGKLSNATAVSDNTTGSTVCLLHQQLSPTGDKFTWGGSLVSGCLGAITLLSEQFEQ
uniref:Uncharacterized protein n=1 Tax=Glossina pallidipes TaxID=7398 RepID=A0A1A9Z4T4_GLOPL